MKKPALVLIFATFFSLTTLARQTAAQEPGAANSPWHEASLSIGGFFSTLDTRMRLGAGIGVDIDVEDALGLESSQNVFRADAYWRFSDNRRHRLDVSWFSYRRDARRTLLDPITIEDDDGTEVTLPADTIIDSTVDLDIYQLAYSYSFLQDDRLDLAVLAGLYVMPTDLRVSSSGLANARSTQSFTAPLPVLGLRIDVMILPDLYLRAGSQFLYLQIEDFTGVLRESTLAIEYNPWHHVGFGLGFDSFQFSIEADGEDYPGIDFTGNFDFEYAGLMLYTRIFY